jgi:hypothetical protein
VSLRALYARGRTLFDHQQQACECLGFQWMTEHQRRALVRVLRDEVVHCSDRERLLVLARQWLYDHRLLIVHDRVIRAMVAAALVELEVSTGQAIMTTVPAATRQRWTSALNTPRPDGEHCQSWLWSAPARHSTRQITEVLERIAFLVDLGVDRHLGDLNDVLVRRYARRIAGRPPSVSSRIKEPARTLEVSCFLRYCACSRPPIRSSSCSSAAWPTCGAAVPTVLPPSWIGRSSTRSCCSSYPILQPMTLCQMPNFARACSRSSRPSAPSARRVEHRSSDVNTALVFPSLAGVNFPTCFSGAQPGIEAWTSFRGRPGRRLIGGMADGSLSSGRPRRCSGISAACSRSRYELPSIGMTTAWCSSRSGSAVATTASPKISAHSPKPRLPVMIMELDQFATPKSGGMRL